jgi:hypothetical protein
MHAVLTTLLSLLPVLDDLKEGCRNLWRCLLSLEAMNSYHMRYMFGLVLEFSVATLPSTFAVSSQLQKES